MAEYAPYNPHTRTGINNQANTGAGEVVADSGAQPASSGSGIFAVTVILGASVAARYDIARRNAADGADVGVVVSVRTIAGQTAQYTFRVLLENNERVVVRTPAAITGSVDAYLEIERLE